MRLEGDVNDGAIDGNAASKQGCQMFFSNPKIPIWVNFGGP
jgi:hypothetical protein